VANPLAAGRLGADILTNYKVFANHPGGLLAVANNLQPIGCNSHGSPDRND
jgi:hypothetical protein